MTPEQRFLKAMKAVLARYYRDEHVKSIKRGIAAKRRANEQVK